jgi:C4-dicarboxylate-specific signal transduction histidine kinase
MAVTSRRAVEERLRVQAAELNHALRLAAAGEMAAALAHELNQPLSAIGSYAGACRKMLSMRPVDLEQINAAMDKMGREVGRAGEVVHRLRDFFRDGTLRLESLAVKQLVGEGLEPLIRKIESKGMALHVQLQENLPAVQVDRVQIATVMRNLVSNAMEAFAIAPERPCEIHVTAVSSGPDRVNICVEDNGPGITAAMLDNIFAPFSTSKAKGMGLGLSISRALVEAHGGKLWAEVPSSGGARFCFSLPAETMLREQHEHH